MRGQCKYVSQVTVNKVTLMHTLHLNCFAQDSIQAHTSYEFAESAGFVLYRLLLQIQALCI